MINHVYKMLDKALYGHLIICHDLRSMNTEQCEQIELIRMTKGTEHKIKVSITRISAPQTSLPLSDSSTYLRDSRPVLRETVQLTLGKTRVGQIRPRPGGRIGVSRRTTNVILGSK